MSFGLDGRDSISGRGKRFFCNLQRPDELWFSPILPSNWYLGVKRPGREADHSPQPSAEVKKMWIYTSILLYDLIKEAQ
jgi:hypothetical protein